MKQFARPKIIFVYNADSGVFNLAADIAHKIFSPQTYACRLCAITHGNFGMKAVWKSFLETLENPLEFLHADEFKLKYHLEKIELPAIFRQNDDGEPVLAVTAAEINYCQNIEDLTAIVRERF